MGHMSEVLRQLPQVQSLLETETGQALIALHGHDQTVAGLRAGLQDIRDAVQTGCLQTVPAFDEVFFDHIAANIVRAQAPNLRKTLNATGVIIHTNMGRAPLAPEALAAIESAAEGYSNLELDLANGTRGSRYSHVEALICELTGAEAALVVNNCAAAVVLCQPSLAGDGRCLCAQRETLSVVVCSFVSWGWSLWGVPL